MGDDGEITESVTVTTLLAVDNLLVTDPSRTTPCKAQGRGRTGLHSAYRELRHDALDLTFEKFDSLLGDGKVGESPFFLLHRYFLSKKRPQKSVIHTQKNAGSCWRERSHPPATLEQR